LGGEDALGRFPRQGRDNPIEHQCLPRGRRPGHHRARAGCQASFAKSLASLLEKEIVAFDVGAHRDAPPGLRIWCGATVDTKDIEALTPWLDFAYATAKDDLAKA